MYLALASPLLLFGLLLGMPRFERFMLGSDRRNSALAIPAGHWQDHARHGARVGRCTPGRSVTRGPPVLTLPFLVRT